MTDLPFGRGGSPLQNLIVRGHKQTKISAIKVVEAMDAGDVYLKEELDLYGTADEIFMRASKIVFKKMIPQILKIKSRQKNNKEKSQPLKDANQKNQPLKGFKLSNNCTITSECWMAKAIQKPLLKQNSLKLNYQGHHGNQMV